jgi:urea transport system permease protein
MDLTFSISMVVWAAVGGRASLLGACVGAILINTLGAKISETEAFVEAWKAIIGFVFVIVVLFLPHGLSGLAEDLVDFVIRLTTGSGRGAQPVKGRDGVQPAE